MADITNPALKTSPVIPSDVFAYEPNTDLGYARDSFELTLGAGQTARVGSVMVVDHAAGTATLAAAPADTTAVDALGDLSIFVGRDTTTNPAVAQDFDRLTATATGVVVGISRGDGRGTVAKYYLDFAGTGFYDLPADVQAALEAKFRLENRFKVQDQAVAR